MFSNKKATFRPKKKGGAKGTKRHQLHKHAKATLGVGDASLSVKLPAGESKEDWVAVMLVSFYNELNIMYAPLEAYCTDESCAVMSAGPQFEYLWADQKQKTPVKLSAKAYISRLMDWVQGYLDDPAVFPPDPSTPFPKHFLKLCAQIFKRLFRVYAHIYYSHFSKIVANGEEAALNTSFKRFYYFVLEYDLCPPKEMAPLDDLINKLGLKK